MNITVTIPVYNEAGVIEPFLRTLSAELATITQARFSYIVVDDGSTDGTYESLLELGKNMDNLQVVRLYRNCGHQSALIAGLQHVPPESTAVLMLDGDGQHPATVARQMVEQWLAAQQRLDVIQGVRQGGKSGTKTMTSNMFYALVRKCLPRITIDSGESDFRLISGELAQFIAHNRAAHHNLRVFLGLLSLQRLKISYVADARWGGTSKYTMRKMARLAIDGLFGFSYIPLRVSHLISALLGLFSLAVLGHAIYVWSIGGTVRGWTSMIGLLALCFCGVFAVLAIQAEYLIMIYESVKSQNFGLNKATSTLGE